MSKSKNAKTRRSRQDAVSGVVSLDGRPDTENAGGGGGSRPVGVAAPVSNQLPTDGIPSTDSPVSSPARKTIRREMLEKFEAHERGDICLDNEMYDFIFETLRDWDDGIDENLLISPILSKKLPNLPKITPDSLKGGYPNSTPPQNPHNSDPAEPHKDYHFGGYDGGMVVGLEGLYREGCLDWLCQFFDEAKEKAGESPDGECAVIMGKHNIIVHSSGAKEGLVYKYRIQVDGIRMLIHHKPPKGRQAIRVTIGAEAFMTNSAPAIWGRVLKFFDAIGFEVSKDVPSRVDFQITTSCITVSEIKHLDENGYIVSKLRDYDDRGKRGGERKSETYTLGKHKNAVRFQFYDKKIEAFSGDIGTPKQALLLEKTGADWVNSDLPMTRFEISVKRDGLRAMGYNSVSDLFGKEWAIINLLTHDWLRILEEPKKKGKEFKQKNHPIWDKIRSLFWLYFPGKNIDEKAEWNPPPPVSCDPAALEAQALGCLSKALAVRHGEQQDKRSSVSLVNGWLDKVSEELHRKLNKIVLHTEIKTGVKLGLWRDSSDAELVHVEGIGRQKRESFSAMFPAPVQQFYDPPGDTAGERFNHFMESTKEIHLRGSR